MDNEMKWICICGIFIFAIMNIEKISKAIHPPTSCIANTEESNVDSIKSK